MKVRALLLAVLVGACTKSVDGSEKGPLPSPAVVEDVDTAVGHGTVVRWITVASLLGDGTESCIDGRSEQPVLGTPGGDVGEILVGLAALERTAKHAIAVDRLDWLFDAYHASFGRLYLHTDAHAMERLAWAIVTDTRFAGVVVPRDARRLRDFVLAPPPGVQEALADLLSRPEHVGCAHLRFAMTEPSRYGVRPDLARAVIAATYRLAWRDRAAVDLVVLEGEHRERGIIEVTLDHSVRAHSRVPLLVPHEGLREYFVYHRDVAAFVRRENGTFFLEHGWDLLPRVPAEDAYLRALDQLADQQARETLGRVARGLPTVRVRASDAEVRVLSDAVPSRFVANARHPASPLEASPLE